MQDVIKGKTDDRFHIGKVLIEGPHAHAGYFRQAVHGQGFHPLLLKDMDTGLAQGRDQ